LNDVRYTTERFCSPLNGHWIEMYRFIIETDHEIFESQLLEENTRFDWMYETKRDQLVGRYIGKPIYRIEVE